MKKPTKNPIAANAVPTKRLHYHIAVGLVFYEKDGHQRQRHVNALLENHGEGLTKKDLSALQQSFMSRIHAENNVTPDMVKDIVIMNIVPLGHMLPEKFHG